MLLYHPDMSAGVKMDHRRGRRSARMARPEIELRTDGKAIGSECAVVEHVGPDLVLVIGPRPKVIPQVDIRSAADRERGSRIVRIVRRGRKIDTSKASQSVGKDPKIVSQRDVIKDAPFGGVVPHVGHRGIIQAEIAGQDLDTQTPENAWQLGEIPVCPDGSAGECGVLPRNRR